MWVNINKKNQEAEQYSINISNVSLKFMSLKSHEYPETNAAKLETNKIFQNFETKMNIQQFQIFCPCFP